MYDKILVPVDLAHEDAGARILSLAARLAGPEGKVIALHVVPEIPTYIETYVPEDVGETRSREQHEALKKLAQAAGLENPDVRVVRGTPHIRILDVAEEVKPDLVIIGSHRPGLSDYFLGSTAARVVRHAACSVLVDR